MQLAAMHQIHKRYEGCTLLTCGISILTSRQFHLPEQGPQLSKDVDHKNLDQTVPQLIYEGAGLDHLKQIIHPTAATQDTTDCA